MCENDAALPECVRTAVDGGTEINTGAMLNW